MKKVGILTFTYGDNYGQRLQNLAVQNKIEMLGFKSYTIPQVMPRKYKIKNEDRHEIFKQFDADFIRYYQGEIGKYKIPQGLRSFDYFVVGSDQVWSPYSSDVNWTFFLKFAPAYKRIAYAPSMATDDIPIKKSVLYRWYLHGFREISVREEKTEDLLHRYTNVNIQTLIDPTLMFDSDFWNQYSRKPKGILPDKYILCYSLGQINESEEITSFAESKNMRLISLREGSPWFNNGPSEFLYLISNAQYVITDSYHGMIFSILYHKPIYIMPRESGNINMNSRFETLFKKLGIVTGNRQGILQKCVVDYN
ncbi:MAG: polysaccharide pyruvyl transferase family protein, partial [Clostridiales bacterium]|nr:polysaccharide pyruvyl transferase family protein [Clostridiales bacterium]